MHKVDGFEIKFTGRATWRADIKKDGKVVFPNVPVAWKDEIKFDKEAMQPREFLVWHTDAEKAEEWAKQTEAVIVVATAKDATQKPKKVKELSRIYRVRPRCIDRDNRCVVSDYIEIVRNDTNP